MNKRLWGLSAVLVTVAAFGLGQSVRDSGQAHAAAGKSGKLLRHVVLFKFKEGSKPEQIQAVVDAFRGLPKKIDAIEDFECGTDVSVENRSEGFTHCFLVTFRDEKGRAAYLPHPAHQELIKLVGPVLDKVLVVDYWTQ